MDIALGHTISLLGVAILVAMLARRLSLPYTVGLVVTGIGLAVTRLETGAMLKGRDPTEIDAMASHSKGGLS